MEKFLILLTVLGINLESIGSTQIISAEKKFNEKISYESKKVIEAYDSEIKKMVKQGKLDLAQELKDKKEMFVDSISSITSADKKVKLQTSLKGKKFIWGFGAAKYTEKFTLDRSGKITGYSCPAETSWGVNDEGQLVVYNAAKEVRWTFVSQEKVKGKWLFKTSDGHYLHQK